MVTDLVEQMTAPGVLMDKARLEAITAAPFQALTVAASRIIDEPVRSDEPASSFVLHAPLELLARHAIHRLHPIEDVRAKQRLVSLAARYGAITGGDRVVRELSVGDAVDLGAAVAEGGPTEAEVAVARRSTAELRPQLAVLAASRTSAAGHANIWVHLHGPSSHGLAPMARTLARELARDPAAQVALDRTLDGLRSVSDGLREVPSAGTPAGRGIAALVAHVDGFAHAELSRLAAAVASDPLGPRALLRTAAAQMLVGTDAVVPYGWTHALTLTQGALTVAAMIDDPRPAIEAAAVYATAFWSAYGGGEIPFAPVGDAPIVDVDWTNLLSAAAQSHDAHLVKYTLACVQCATQDPPAARLFHDAAVRLHDWWSDHPPEDDPLADE